MSSSKQDERGDHASKSDLQSANQLIVDAIIAITNIVESMHHRINPLSKFSSTPNKEPQRGMTRLVYQTIQNITELVGKGLDVPLGMISEALGKKGRSPSGEALIAALNGVLGDHLVKQQSPLAIPMTLYQDGNKISSEALAQGIKKAEGRLVIMVHGLCMNHLQWQQRGHDHGKALSNDLNVTTAYLHYNTGLHVFENGKAFSHTLEKLITQVLEIDPDIELEISIVAHSMGGLVARSAIHQAKSFEHRWPEYFENIVFLGTPHHGAPLEKAGSWLDMLLGIHGYTAPLTRLTKFRSAGIRDLRHGNLLASDAEERKPFEFHKDKRTPTPLPKDVNCFTVATTASDSPNKTTETLVGDGLVSVNSALGKHESKPFTLLFPVRHQWIARDINHMQLLSHPDVYITLRNWLEK